VKSPFDLRKPVRLSPSGPGKSRWLEVCHSYLNTGTLHGNSVMSLILHTHLKSDMVDIARRMMCFVIVLHWLTIVLLVVEKIDGTSASFIVAPITLQNRYRHRIGTTGIYPSITTISAGHRMNDDDHHDDNDDDFDDEDDSSTAYGNRSLAWTRKYRELLPYEYARKQAMQLGLRCKEEWDDYLADGKVYHGPYLPTRPDEMYVQDWISWEEFLGIMRTYEDTQQLVRNILRITSEGDYNAFVTEDPSRAEGLRIPACPDIVYRNAGWKSWDHFLGQTKSVNHECDNQM
jgi:hypothetical protein